MVFWYFGSLTWLGTVFQYCPRVVLSVSLGAGVVLYYLIEVVKKPVFASRSKSQWTAFLKDHLEILEERYWPTFWCFESRAQTVLASVFRQGMRNMKYRREIIKLKDGGQTCLDWMEDCGSSNGKSDSRSEKSYLPIVVLLPGLTGSSQSEYIKSFVCAAHDVGAQCVVLNNRGRGGIPLKTPLTYCAANSDDLEEALRHIKSLHPNAKIVAAGISLGGMIVGNYLASRGEKACQYLTSAMVLSIPFNVFIGTESLERPVCNLILNKHLAYCLCESVNEMREVLDNKSYPWDLDFVLKSKTIREFDSRFTSKQFGYEDVDAYYRDASLHDKMDKVRVPLICLSAADDPFQPINGIPLDAVRESSHVAIVLTSRGGHIGFLEGILPIKKYYSDRLFSQLIQAVFGSPDDLMDKVNEEAKKYNETKERKLENGFH